MYHFLNQFNMSSAVSVWRNYNFRYGISIAFAIRSVDRLPVQRHHEPILCLDDHSPARKLLDSNPVAKFRPGRFWLQLAPFHQCRLSLCPVEARCTPKLWPPFFYELGVLFLRIMKPALLTFPIQSFFFYPGAYCRIREMNPFSFLKTNLQTF